VGTERVFPGYRDLGTVKETGNDVSRMQRLESVQYRTTIGSYIGPRWLSFPFPRSQADNIQLTAANLCLLYNILYHSVRVFYVLSLGRSICPIVICIRFPLGRSVGIGDARRVGREMQCVQRIAVEIPSPAARLPREGVFTG